jgi:hypothetical protein
VDAGAAKHGVQRRGAFGAGLVTLAGVSDLRLVEESRQTGNKVAREKAQDDANDGSGPEKPFGLPKPRFCHARLPAPLIFFCQRPAIYPIVKAFYDISPSTCAISAEAKRRCASCTKAPSALLRVASAPFAHLRLSSAAPALNSKGKSYL